MNIKKIFEVLITELYSTFGDINIYWFGTEDTTLNITISDYHISIVPNFVPQGLLYGTVSGLEYSNYSSINYCYKAFDINSPQPAQDILDWIYSIIIDCL